ncbi:hypothetical protein B0H14DRAFT_3552634 [Mycena olivaceomarginata]|nr:hypothetical protein B0H14DRAFT_3552634 [Mycena olivaceomarginata]
MDAALPHDRDPWCSRTSRASVRCSAEDGGRLKIEAPHFVYVYAGRCHGAGVEDLIAFVSDPIDSGSDSGSDYEAERLHATNAFLVDGPGCGGSSPLFVVPSLSRSPSLALSFYPSHSPPAPQDQTRGPTVEIAPGPSELESDGCSRPHLSSGGRPWIHPSIYPSILSADARCMHIPARAVADTLVCWMDSGAANHSSSVPSCPRTDTHSDTSPLAATETAGACLRRRERAPRRCDLVRAKTVSHWTHRTCARHVWVFPTAFMGVHIFASFSLVTPTPPPNVLRHVSSPPALEHPQSRIPALTRRACSSRRRSCAILGSIVTLPMVRATGGGESGHGLGSVLLHGALGFGAREDGDCEGGDIEDEHSSRRAGGS